MQLCKQEAPKNAALCKRRDQQMKEDKICISKLAHDKKAFQNHYMRTYVDRARLTACEVRVFSFQQLIKGTD